MTYPLLPLGAPRCPRNHEGPHLHRTPVVMGTPVLPWRSLQPGHEGEMIHALRIGDCVFLSDQAWEQAQPLELRRKARRWFRTVTTADEAVGRLLAKLTTEGLAAQ